MNATLSRRDLLSSLAALALAPRTPARAAPRLILIWLDGGASHLDTFDAKPEAGVHIRGDLRWVRASRDSARDDVFFHAELAQLAQRLRRCALVRSLTHGEGNHDRGTHLGLTGKRPSPVLVHPALPAVLAHASPRGDLPAFVCIPDAPQFAGAGFLPAVCGPFEVGGDPGRADFVVRDLTPRDDNTAALAVMTQLDRLAGPPRTAAEASRDEIVAQALRMSQVPAIAEAFDLRREPADVRARFGAHRLGQSCLLARRLVRAGTRAVLVRDAGWDHHVQIARALTYGFPPKLRALDQAVSALLDDLDGGDGDVLVCVATEFGRTPRLNPAGGRDHWPRAQSALLYGAGVRAGVVVGATDAHGEEPVRDPVSPADLFATLAIALGLPRDLVLHTQDGRPVRLIDDGALPIAGVLA
jgi:uncharacterized protein (DUF1501 family)